jgi:putative colanic acid biosynthesis UDP-glucose lipid carrier transferase
MFSLIIILGLLSWLVPILAFLIKLGQEVFFKQGRPGIDENEFFVINFVL